MATRTEPIDFLAGGVALAIGVLISGATQGSILFVGTSADLTEDNANLFWDDANNRLGLLTATPSDTLDIGAGGTLRLRDITQGSVIFAAADGVLSQDNDGLFFDATNIRLGIGTAAPQAGVTVSESNSSLAADMLITHTAVSGASVSRLQLAVNSGSTGDPVVLFTVSGGSPQFWVMGVDNSGADAFKIAESQLLATDPRLVIVAGGNVGIGLVGPTARLHISDPSALTSFEEDNTAAAATGNQVAIIHQLQSTLTLRSALNIISNFDVITDASRISRVRFQLVDGATTVTPLTLRGDSAGIGVDPPARRLHVEQEDGSVGSVTQLLRLTHTTSGTPIVGIGVGMEFEVETAIGNNEIGALIEAVTIDVGAGTEDFDLVFRTMLNGAAAAERMRIRATAGVLLTDIEIDGALNHDGSTVGFYGTTPIVQQTGVAVSAAGVHAALVNLGLITA